MPASTTSRLLLTKPDPNPVTGDFVDINVLNADFDRIDAAAGAFPCTSGTRPTGTDRWDGRLIRETDTRRTLVWNATQAVWDILGVIVVANLAARNALTGLYDGMQVWRSDTKCFNVYDGAVWRYFATRPTSNTVATSQTTTNTSYTDLATVGPAVTVETGTDAEVTISCTMSNAGGNHCYASFAVSGATTQVAVDDRGMFVPNTNFIRMSTTVPVTGLTAGNNTFTMKYKVGLNTGTFVDRRIHVKPC